VLSPILITPPAAMPITLDEAKAQCRVEIDVDDENGLIQDYISAAVDHLDGYAGILGRCLMPQTWSQEYEAAYGDLVLPLGPVISVTAVTNDFADFRLLKDGRGHFLRLNSGASWPSGPVTVEFVAGYTTIPPALKIAMLLHIETLYEHRGMFSDGAEPNLAYERHVDPYRMIGV
jgi:uncharacterized phiE125 gp8 family phage protein